MADQPPGGGDGVPSGQVAGSENDAAAVGGAGESAAEQKPPVHDGHGEAGGDAEAAVADTAEEADGAVEGNEASQTPSPAKETPRLAEKYPKKQHAVDGSRGTPRSIGSEEPEKLRPVEELSEAELREELTREREAHARTREELALFQDGATQLNAELVSVKEQLESGRRGSGSRGSGAPSVGTLQTELEESRKRQEELEQYSRELDGVVDRLQASLDEEKAKAGKTSDERVMDAEARVEEMRRQAEAMKADHKRMERELEAAGRLIGEGRGRPADGEGDIRDGVPYDVLDQLDGELQEAKTQLRQTQAELEQSKTLLAAAQRAASESSEWKDAAVQAQEQVRETSAALVTKTKEAEMERRMRREIEARFDEKLHLKTREVQGHEVEIERLKRAGEQLEPLLAEMEHLKAESRHKLDHRAREIQRLQVALQDAEKARQIAEGNLQVMKGELQQWEAKVKNAEEVRWMAGMNLAKAKAEMDWRQKADQEKDFFLERMKDELERLKVQPLLCRPEFVAGQLERHSQPCCRALQAKLMRTEMRKLKVEESLGEAVLELRGKKREMEQLKSRVQGILQALSVPVRYHTLSSRATRPANVSQLIRGAETSCSPLNDLI